MMPMRKIEIIAAIIQRCVGAMAGELLIILMYGIFEEFIVDKIKSEFFKASIYTSFEISIIFILVFTITCIILDIRKINKKEFEDEQ